MREIILIAAMFLAAAAAARCAAETPAPGEKPAESAYAAWKHGPSKDPGFFPICVWLQDPARAPDYKAIGINCYVGLWQGPTEKQLAELKKHEMPVICSQNAVGLAHKDDPLIIAWMHGDEPDNAQALPDKKGYGPPIAPEKIIEDYQKIRKADPSRPVILNLGQGVAWDGWHGRGVRTNHPEDYADYVKGCDVVSFDIYPANGEKEAVKNKLWLVPFGVDRLRKWSNDEKVVWNCIECTPFGGAVPGPTPHQVKAEVWMSLIHGSKGLIYFVHVFKPKFIEAGLLADTKMAQAVGEINRRIAELAPALNSPTIVDGASVESSNKDVPVDIMVKRHGGATYLFAVAMRDGATRATFEVKGLSGGTAEVLGENRKIDLKDGRFEDEFKSYEVHLYRIAAGG